MCPQQKPQREPPGARFGLVVTNFLRLAGGVVVLNEALVEAAPRSKALAAASLMIIGAQGLETFVMSFFGIQRRPKE